MIDVLASTALFHGLPEVELRKVAAIASRRSCPAGHHVFLTGDIATEFFVVATGAVRVFIPTADDQLDVSVVRPGEVFGEGAMLDGGPRVASAYSLEPTTLLAIGREEWLDLIDRDVMIPRRVFAALGASMRRYVRHTVDSLLIDVDIPDYPADEAGSGL